jgi:hypothetical protein
VRDVATKSANDHYISRKRRPKAASAVIFGSKEEHLEGGNAMKKDIIRQFVNVLAVVAVLVVNGLANALPLNNQTTGEISDRFQVYFVPAGYVFSIWGLIYLGLLAFAVFQALPAQRDNPRLRRVGYLFAASCVANIALADCHLPAFGDWPRRGLPGREVVGTRAFQHLPGLDHGGDHRQRDFSAGLPGMGRMGHQ